HSVLPSFAREVEGTLIALRRAQTGKSFLSSLARSVNPKSSNANCGILPILFRLSAIFDFPLTLTVLAPTPNPASSDNLQIYPRPISPIGSMVLGHYSQQRTLLVRTKVNLGTL